MDTTKISSYATKEIRTYWSKKFPYKSKFNHTEAELKEIERKFDYWYIFSMFYTLVCLAVLCILYGQLFYKIYIAAFEHFKKPGDVLYLFSRDPFFGAGFVLSLMTAPLAVDRTQYLLMGKKYEIYNDYYCAMKGYDEKPAMKQFLAVLSVVFIILLSAFSTSFLRINNDSITVKAFYHLYPKTYNLQEIDHGYRCKQEKYRDGTRSHISYDIKMKNGEIFNTSTWFSEGEELNSFVKYLIQHGISIENQPETTTTQTNTSLPN